MGSGTSCMLGEMNRCVRFCDLENSQTLLCGWQCSCTISRFGGHPRTFWIPLSSDFLIAVTELDSAARLSQSGYRVSVWSYSSRCDEVSSASFWKSRIYWRVCSITRDASSLFFGFLWLATDGAWFEWLHLAQSRQPFNCFCDSGLTRQGADTRRLYAPSPAAIRSSAGTCIRVVPDVSTTALTSWSVTLFGSVNDNEFRHQ